MIRRRAEIKLLRIKREPASYLTDAFLQSISNDSMNDGGSILKFAKKYN